MSAVGTPAARTGGGPAAAPLGAGWRTLLTPAGVLLAAVATVAYTQAADLDSTEARSLNLPHIAAKTWEHVGLTAVSTLLVLAIAVPLGVLVSRRWMRWSTPAVLAVANIGQSAPPVGVIVLLAIAVGIGFWPAVVALVLYGMLPALRNTMVGLREVDPALVEAARGIGMSAWRVLVRVELPLAVPVILAGVRTTVVHNVGVAGLAAFINGGGLGELVVSGVNTSRVATLVVGSVLIALLALLVDWIAGVVTAALRPKGL
ncbi:ABC transporter permease [Marinitenerispora sediminis]|uniref:ABC transporter permease n=1 Tax=Marinitenerispora sediminis TaxID=1931232 RepID=A0A368TAC0_9ACTN|nr:ABC transporter permease [Marinitenerispora sediminis]RCV54648.1 ABC transporter permease [Marinitenerispora sediminis]RCV56405.1 ABC transporter permease [Marinitenerispora sediminis]RCV59749.1 ABC transporter permease [Marinitenerispora sediminis]